MDISLRSKECLFCGNDKISLKANYCIACSHDLYNHCSDNECNAVNHESAKYCEICGSETLFYQELRDMGLLE